MSFFQSFLEFFQLAFDFIVRYSGIAALAMSLIYFGYWCFHLRPRLFFTDPRLDNFCENHFFAIQMICSNKGSLPLSIVSAEYLRRSVWTLCSFEKYSEIPIMLGPYESKKCIFMFPVEDSSFSFIAHGDKPDDSEVNLKILTSRGKTKCRFHVDQVLSIKPPQDN